MKPLTSRAPSSHWFMVLEGICRSWHVHFPRWKRMTIPWVPVVDPPHPLSVWAPSWVSEGPGKGDWDYPRCPSWSSLLAMLSGKLPLLSSHYALALPPPGVCREHGTSSWLGRSTQRKQPDILFTCLCLSFCPSQSQLGAQHEHRASCCPVTMEQSWRCLEGMCLEAPGNSQWPCFLMSCQEFSSLDIPPQGKRRDPSGTLMSLSLSWWDMYWREGRCEDGECHQMH